MSAVRLILSAPDSHTGSCLVGNPDQVQSLAESEIEAAWPTDASMQFPKLGDKGGTTRLLVVVAMQDVELVLTTLEQSPEDVLAVPIDVPASGIASYAVVIPNGVRRAYVRAL